MGLVLNEDISHFHVTKNILVKHFYNFARLSLLYRWHKILSKYKKNKENVERKNNFENRIN